MSPITLKDKKTGELNEENQKLKEEMTEKVKNKNKFESEQKQLQKKINEFKINMTS